MIALVKDLERGGVKFHAKFSNTEAGGRCKLEIVRTDEHNEVTGEPLFEDHSFRLRMYLNIWQIGKWLYKFQTKDVLQLQDEESRSGLSLIWREVSRQGQTAGYGLTLTDGRSKLSFGFSYGEVYVLKMFLRKTVEMIMGRDLARSKKTFSPKPGTEQKRPEAQKTVAPPQVDETWGMGETEGEDEGSFPSSHEVQTSPCDDEDTMPF